MTEQHENRRDDDEPLPPLPIDPSLSFGSRPWWAVGIALLAIAAFRLLIALADDDREAERPPATTRVITDPGAGLSPEERDALEEAVRRGRPLSLDSEGRLRPAD